MAFIIVIRTTTTLHIFSHGSHVAVIRKAVITILVTLTTCKTLMSYRCEIRFDVCLKRKIEYLNYILFKGNTMDDERNRSNKRHITQEVPFSATIACRAPYNHSVQI